MAPSTPHPAIVEAEKRLAAAKDAYGHAVAGIARSLKPVVAADPATVPAANRVLAAAADVVDAVACLPFAAAAQPAAAVPKAAKKKAAKKKKKKKK